MTKLTYEEYKKAIDAGMSLGMGACACSGAINEDDPYCGCSMAILNILDEDGQIKLMEEWINAGYLTYQEIRKKWDEEIIPEKIKPQLTIREKRLALMKEKGYL